ncbi:jg26108 [Pararge aegeria aegeria]|uniref:Jg26108 protein n=1 Tax=Pararge aegeria aegeria TaxID=348720 RepID=A0A8S4SC49_9NEOP|nr:jg26108 [Pararge aegeria aegeria]
MFRLIALTLVVAVTVIALPSRLPNPTDIAFTSDDQFEDYLDAWLTTEQLQWFNQSSTSLRSGCSLRINGDFGQPQPVFLHRSRSTFLTPSSNSGLVRLNVGEEIIISCTGANRLIRHPNVVSNVHTATARCVNNNLVSGAGWLSGNQAFGQITCSSHAVFEAQQTNQRCFNNNVVIRVGFIVNNVFHVHYWSCFNPTRMEVLYVWYNQDDTNGIFQSGVDRPSWLAGPFFPGVNINTIYTQNNQRQVIANLLGSNMVDRYITSNQFLARGHLAAKTDYVFATGQRSTFYFINAAPQWQPFNAGNWMSLEANLRRRIAAARYNTVIYTGTFGVTQLRNSAGRLVDIHLHSNNRVPVPQYFYKVVYDASRRQGTAYISINNPYYTLAEARQLQFCTDRCRNNAAFNWINWQPDRVDIGYSFCCTIPDFRRRIAHVPNFNVANGLLS